MSDYYSSKDYNLDEIREAMARGVLLGWAKAVDAFSDMFVHARGEIVSFMSAAGIQVTKDPPPTEDEEGRPQGPAN